MILLHREPLFKSPRITTFQTLLFNNFNGKNCVSDASFVSFKQPYQYIIFFNWLKRVFLYPLVILQCIALDGSSQRPMIRERRDLVRDTTQEQTL